MLWNPESFQSPLAVTKTPSLILPWLILASLCKNFRQLWRYEISLRGYIVCSLPESDIVPKKRPTLSVLGSTGSLQNTHSKAYKAQWLSTKFLRFLENPKKQEHLGVGEFLTSSPDFSTCNYQLLPRNMLLSHLALPTMFHHWHRSFSIYETYFFKGISQRNSIENAKKVRWQVVWKVGFRITGKEWRQDRCHILQFWKLTEVKLVAKRANDTDTWN